MELLNKQSIELAGHHGPPHEPAAQVQNYSTMNYAKHFKAEIS